MAVGAPRNPRPCAPNCTKSKEGKTGERKRNRDRQREKSVNEGQVVETTFDDTEIRTEEKEMERFIALDSNGDEFITKKEFKSNTEKGNTGRIFQLADLDKDKKISKEEFLHHYRNFTTPLGNCGSFSMNRCAREFNLTVEETILATGLTTSSNDIFCAALQSYVNCIALEKHLCPELEQYAQRIKRTSTAYRNGGVCPNMDTSKFNAQVPRHSRGQQTDFVAGETRRRSRVSREKRGTNRKTIAHQQCLRNKFAPCHDEFFETLDHMTNRCELIKEYRCCIRRTTKRCRGDKTYVKKIISGLKFIRKAHLEADVCRLKT